MLKIREGIVYMLTQTPSGIAIIRIPRSNDEAELIAHHVKSTADADKIIEEDAKCKNH